MTKDTKKLTIITTLICLIPIIIGIILYPQLPDTIVTHWDGQGNPNGWSPKFMGVIVFPGILAILNLFAPVLLRMDPKYDNIGSKGRTLIQWILPLVEVFCSSTTLASALGMDSRVTLTGPMLMGIIFIMIGNYLPKMGQSYTVGIKLPWTLADEENWRSTHRLSGFLWVCGGFLTLICGFLPYKRFTFPVIFVALIIVPTVYSYWHYRKHHK